MMSEETNLANKTTLRFTQEFKEMIQEIQSMDIVKGLQHSDLDILQETQQNIRDYLHTLYKKRKLSMPDIYAIMVSLCVPDIEEYNSWDDFKDKFFPVMSFVGTDFENMEGVTYKCCCSQKVSGENVTVLRCGNHYLAAGDVCINKYSIVYKFDEFKKKKKAIYKERKITIRKPHPTKKFLNREIEEYKPAATIRDETYTNLLKEYKRKHDAENHRCECGTLCGIYQKCFACKVKTQDKCACGKWKEKKYGTCYTCRFKRD